ncbi:MAG: hypothetical protein KatS3mg034_1052 [Vicingaceae bacterium]|nr:MAG: hypothetical protein KatS3mg034_1052 [Vicingaceae bacterium]
MKMRFIFLFIIFITSPGFVNSQENNLDKYIPQSNKAKEYYNNEEMPVNIMSKKNYIFSDLLLLRGIASISYDRLISNRLIIGMGIGSVLYKDLMLSLSLDIINMDNSTGNTIGFTSLFSRGEFNKGLIYINPNIKYIIGDYYNDSYKYVSLDFRKWGFKSKLINNEPAPAIFLPNNTIDFNVYSFNFKYGSRVLFNSKSKLNLFTDIYSGIGVKFYKYSEFQYSYEYDSIMNTYFTYYRKLEDYNIVRPFFLFGFSLGVAF